MRNLIIDSRIRNIEYEYLSKYFNVIKLPLSEDVYEEISGHSDIFYCMINDRIISSPNAKIIEQDFIIGQKRVERDYPNDVAYNVCQIGGKVIGSKFIDKAICPDIIVKQGYVKCSISITGQNSCITTDKKIAEILLKNDIDATYIEESKIKLLKKDGSVSSMRGFIGGATLTFDNKFVVFGDIEKLESKDIIVNHINKYGLELVDFKGLDVYDYGGGIIY